MASPLLQQQAGVQGACPPDLRTIPASTDLCCDAVHAAFGVFRVGQHPGVPVPLHTACSRQAGGFRCPVQCLGAGDGNLYVHDGNFVLSNPPHSAAAGEGIQLNGLKLVADGAA